MKKSVKHIAGIFLCCFVFFCQKVVAQTQTDRLFSKANALIYEDPDQAISIGKEIYELPELPIKKKVNVLLLISTAYSSKRDYSGAQKYILRAEELLPEIKDERTKMNILNRIGAQYQDLQIYDKAIEYLNVSLGLMENYPKKDSIQELLGYNSTIRGFIYREQMSCDIALKYFDKAILAYSKTFDKYIKNANTSVCYYNKGNCLLNLGRTEEAKMSFLNSITSAKNAEANSLIAFAQKGLAAVKTTEGNYRESISILDEALQLSKPVGDLILNKGIFEGLANNYLALNDTKKYQFYHQKFSELQNQIKNSERQTINQSLVNLSKSKAEEIAQVSKFYNPTQIVMIILLILLLIFFIFFVIKSEKGLKALQKKLRE